MLSMEARRPDLRAARPRRVTTKAYGQHPRDPRAGQPVHINPQKAGKAANQLHMAFPQIEPETLQAIWGHYHDLALTGALEGMSVMRFTHDIISSTHITASYETVAKLVRHMKNNFNELATSDK
jgi:hypothetical protein